MTHADTHIPHEFCAVMVLWCVSLQTVKETILSDITECGKKEGLLSFEQVRPTTAAQHG